MRNVFSNRRLGRAPSSDGSSGSKQEQKNHSQDKTLLYQLLNLTVRSAEAQIVRLPPHPKKGRCKITDVFINSTVVIIPHHTETASVLNTAVDYSPIKVIVESL